MTREPYHYGYQGQFAEQDEESGWNSFEARQWDARIGRWLSVDPSRQFYSSYLGMGNNPVNGVDPDGRDWFKNQDGTTQWFDNTSGGFSDIDGNSWANIGTNDLDVFSPMMLGEVSISAGMSQSATSAAKLGIYQGHHNFMIGSLDLTRYTFGRTGALTTAVGLGVAPFAPPIGAGLIGVGETFSTVAGVSSAVLNLSEGNYTGAVIDAAFIATGTLGNKGLEGLKSSQTINATSETILRGVQNTSLDVMNFFVVPQTQGQ